MLKLIKLEWKKNNIGKYIRNAVILAIILHVSVCTGVSGNCK